jgi:hypothetical protein
VRGEQAQAGGALLPLLGGVDRLRPRARGAPSSALLDLANPIITRAAPARARVAGCTGDGARALLGSGGALSAAVVAGGALFYGAAVISKGGADRGVRLRSMEHPLELRLRSLLRAKAWRVSAE